MRLARAIDLWEIRLGEEGKTPATRNKYVRDTLALFAKTLDAETTVDEPTRDDVRLYLGQWVDKAPSWNGAHTALRLFFDFTIAEGWRDHGSNPLDGIGRKRRKPADELDVTTVDEDEVGLLFAACQEVDEFLCLAVLAYTGARRSAAARLKWRDLNFSKGTLRLFEKNRKINVLPMADELREILYSVGLSGVTPNAPDDYVVPNRASGRNGAGVAYRSMAGRERSAKVIYKLIDNLGERAGVDVHPHALRAAFAVHYYESAGSAGLLAVKDLLGHARSETTEVYLRRRNKAQAKETVRGLSWASALQPSSLMPPAGFEPALGDNTLPKPLRSKLEELRAGSRSRARNARR